MLNYFSYREIFSKFPNCYNVCNVCKRNKTNGFAEGYEMLKSTTEKEIALEAMQYYQCEGFTEVTLIPTFDDEESEFMTPKEWAAFFRTYYYKQSDEFC